MSMPRKQAAAKALLWAQRAEEWGGRDAGDPAGVAYAAMFAQVSQAWSAIARQPGEAATVSELSEAGRFEARRIADQVARDMARKTEQTRRPNR
jgi:hypothetical protein